MFHLLLLAMNIALLNVRLVGLCSVSSGGTGLSDPNLRKVLNSLLNCPMRSEGQYIR